MAELRNFVAVMLVFFMLFYTGMVTSLQSHEQTHYVICKQSGGVPEIRIDYLILKGETVCVGSDPSSADLHKFTEIIGYSNTGLLINLWAMVMIIIMVLMVRED